MFISVQEAKTSFDTAFGQSEADDRFIDIKYLLQILLAIFMF